MSVPQGDLERRVPFPAFDHLEAGLYTHAWGWRSPAGGIWTHRAAFFIATTVNMEV